MQATDTTLFPGLLFLLPPGMRDGREEALEPGFFFCPGAQGPIISLPEALIVLSRGSRSPGSFVAEPGAQSNKR